MKNCKIPSTRRKMFIEFNSRCIDSNTKIFEDILEIRHQVHNIT
jgi:hypothetical protein